MFYIVSPVDGWHAEIITNELSVQSAELEIGRHFKMT